MSFNVLKLRSRNVTLVGKHEKRRISAIFQCILDMQSPRLVKNNYEFEYF